MDSDTATRFVASLAQSIQALCHGYVDFHSSVEVIGHIYLNVDNGSKFNYIVNEEVSKFPPNNTSSTMFRTHSYYSVPPDTINNESHSCFQNLDTEILVVSKSGFSQRSSKELNASFSLEKPVNLSSTPHLLSFDNEKVIDYKRKYELSPVATDLTYLSPKMQGALVQTQGALVQTQGALVLTNPKRKRKKSETTKYVNHVTLNNDIIVDNSVLNNNLEEDLCCDDDLLLNESKKSCSPPEMKSMADAQASNGKKKRRKSEPSKCVPHLTMKDPETNDNIFILKNELDDSYSTDVKSDFAVQDEYALVKKEIFLNTDYCEPLSNCDFKDSLPYSSSRDQALELIKNSSVNFQRDSSLLDTLNTSFSPSTKTITAQLRHQIVEYANIVGNRPAARHFGVHESSIRHWRKRFIYGDAAVKKKKKKKDMDLFEKEIENVRMVESPLSVSS